MEPGFRSWCPGVLALDSMPLATGLFSLSTWELGGPQDLLRTPPPISGVAPEAPLQAHRAPQNLE